MDVGTAESQNTVNQVFADKSEVKKVCLDQRSPCHARMQQHSRPERGRKETLDCPHLLYILVFRDRYVERKGNKGIKACAL